MSVQPGQEPDVHDHRNPCSPCRNRRSASPESVFSMAGIGVQLRAESVFSFDRNGCSGWAGARKQDCRFLLGEATMPSFFNSVSCDDSARLRALNRPRPAKDCGCCNHDTEGHLATSSRAPPESRSEMVFAGLPAHIYGIAPISARVSRASSHAATGHVGEFPRGCAKSHAHVPAGDGAARRQPRAGGVGARGAGHRLDNAGTRDPLVGRNGRPRHSRAHPACRAQHLAGADPNRRRLLRTARAGVAPGVHVAFRRRHAAAPRLCQHREPAAGAGEGEAP